MNFKEELENILKSDPLELLILKPATSPITSDQRLISSFAEINDFIKLNSQEPTESSDVNERRLFSRLKEIRKDPTKVKVLKEYDQNNLLGEPKKIETVDDILENDYLGILDSDAEDIFELKNVKIQKNKADFVARRKPCKDFHKYEGKFHAQQIKHENRLLYHAQVAALDREIRKEMLYTNEEERAIEREKTNTVFAQECLLLGVKKCSLAGESAAEKSFLHKKRF